MSSCCMYLATDVPDFMHDWLSYCGHYCALSRHRYKIHCERCIVLVECGLKTVHTAKLLAQLVVLGKRGNWGIEAFETINARKIVAAVFVFHLYHEYYEKKKKSTQLVMNSTDIYLWSRCDLSW